MTDLRAEARRLFDCAVRAADPALALRAGLAENSINKPVKGGRYLIVSVGKAAIPMIEEALRSLTDAPVVALAVTNYENARDVPGATVMASGHPVPDENGRLAGEAVADLLSGATAEDRVVALISGGGSALLPAPVDGVSLAEKAEVNKLLLANGYEITEINLVRQQLSRLKGGGMLRLAAPAPITAFILSDVIGDDLRVIASGPTVSPIGTPAMARALFEERGLWAHLPASVRAHLNSAETRHEDQPQARNILIGSNRKSLQAVMKACKYSSTDIASDELTGDVADACEVILQAAGRQPPGKPVCLIFGGETTVVLRGNGRGGRNQELALRVALSAPARLKRPFLFLSGGTDGRDGPTDAAGGLVDEHSAERMRAAGVDPEALLANNDSYAALAASGDLLMTGATGTNVADVQILLLG